MNYFEEKQKALEQIYAPLDHAYNERKNKLEKQSNQLLDSMDTLKGQYEQNNDTLNNTISDTEYIQNGNNPKALETYNRIKTLLNDRYNALHYTMTESEKDQALKKLKINPRQEQKLIDDAFKKVQEDIEKLKKSIIEYRQVCDSKEIFYKAYYVAFGEYPAEAVEHNSPTNELSNLTSIYLGM